MMKSAQLMMLLTLFALITLLLGCAGSSRTDHDEQAAAAMREHDAFVNRGQQYLDEQLLDSALVVFNRALEKQDRSFPAHMGIGEVHERRGEHTKAIGSFHTAREIKPDDFRANYHLAFNQHLISDLHAAATNYLSALAINPHDFEANLNLATTYIQLDRPRLALPYAEKAVSLNSQSQPAHANLGTIYISLGRSQDAIESYEKALLLGELALPIRQNLANAYIESEDYPKARDQLGLILESDPSVWAYERLGYVHFKMNDYRRGSTAYEQAIKADPENIPALNGYGITLMAEYIRSGRENPEMKEKALTAWQRSIRLNRDQPRILSLISRYQNL